MSGYAEFNDSTSVLRGIIAGANGTFSGRFTADNVNAISGINIRNGSVTGFYTFSVDTSLADFSFTVPALSDVNWVDIVIPIEAFIKGTTQLYSGSVSIYKNGTLFGTDTYTPNAGLRSWPHPRGGGMVEKNYGIYLLQTMRVVDTSGFSSPTTYRVVLTGFEHIDSAAGDSGRDEGIAVKMKLAGPVVVGVRKR